LKCVLLTPRERSDLVLYVERGWLVILLPEEYALLLREKTLLLDLNRYRISQWIKGRLEVR